ncbi:hypothetical protein EVAR_101198_1 [Eumeta japonica]|uniref:Uncharacterized protein n=1 Tax=Eumeta variegata TaxID=151549 RepID=A0A4C2AG54_EUMVA|nr:hypothetical protein EVAR_101198_1 [Eumeta japonica]
MGSSIHMLIDLIFFDEGIRFSQTLQKITAVSRKLAWRGRRHETIELREAREVNNECCPPLPSASRFRLALASRVPTLADRSQCARSARGMLMCGGDGGVVQHLSRSASELVPFGHTTCRGTVGNGSQWAIVVTTQLEKQNALSRKRHASKVISPHTPPHQRVLTSALSARKIRPF